MTQRQAGRLYWQTSHGGEKLAERWLVVLLVAAGSIEHPRECRGPRNVLVQRLQVVGYAPEIGVMLAPMAPPYVRPFRGLRRAQEYAEYEGTECVRRA